METRICTDENELPSSWFSYPTHSGTYDLALQLLREETTIVVARRSDGEIQIVPEDCIDAEVIEALLKWAAYVKPAC